MTKSVLRRFPRKRSTDRDTEIGNVIATVIGTESAMIDAPHAPRKVDATEAVRNLRVGHITAAAIPNTYGGETMPILTIDGRMKNPLQMSRARRRKRRMNPSFASLRPRE